MKRLRKSIVGHVTIGHECLSPMLPHLAHHQKDGAHPYFFIALTFPDLETVCVTAGLI